MNRVNLEIIFTSQQTFSGGDVRSAHVFWFNFIGKRVSSRLLGLRHASIYLENGLKESPLSDIEPSEHEENIMAVGVLWSNF